MSKAHDAPLHGRPAAAGTPRWPARRRVAMWALAIVVLLGVFLLYAQPDLIVTLANQLWACL